MRVKVRFWAALIALCAWNFVGCGTPVSVPHEHESAPSPLTVTTQSATEPARPRELTENATTEMLYASSPFDGPLVPFGTAPTAEENRALAIALRRWASTTTPNRDDVLDEFLHTNPNSPWRASVLMGLASRHTQRAKYVRALREFNAVWELTREAKEEPGTRLATRALAELIQLRVAFGQTAEVEPLLREAAQRPLAGEVPRIRAAAITWAQMKHDPQDNFRCGLRAVARMSHTLTGRTSESSPLANVRANSEGLSLEKLQEAAQTLGSPVRVVRRERGAPMVAPAVVHWSVGHYAAVVRAGHMIDGDPTWLMFDASFGGEVTVPQSAFDEDPSGYFLVPTTVQLPRGWREASAEEAARVWGRGPTTNMRDGYDRLSDLLNGGACGRGMAEFGFHPHPASLHVHDTPVWVNPPFGPAVDFMLVWNQNSDPQRESFGSRFSDRWSYNWSQYVQQIYGRTRVVLGTGGYAEFTSVGMAGTPGTDSERNPRDMSTLQWDSAGNRYIRRLADGGIEFYGYTSGLSVSASVCTSNGSCGTLSAGPQYFLTEKRDPQGNAVTLNYDTQGRLTRITDASGRNWLSLTYRNNTSPMDLDYRRISRIEGFNGDGSAPVSLGAATFEYGDIADGFTRLTSITDMQGIQSRFTYGPAPRFAGTQSVSASSGSGGALTLTGPVIYTDGGFLSSMTTPYGTTNFYTWADLEEATYGSHNGRMFVRFGTEAVHPTMSAPGVRERERIEFREFWTGYCDPDGIEMGSCVHTRDYLEAPSALATDPSNLGGRNNFLAYRNAWYWNARAHERARAHYDATDTDPTHAEYRRFTPTAYGFAQSSHWLHAGTSDLGLSDDTIGVPESTRAPGESRVWYRYEGQADTQNNSIAQVEHSHLPVMIARKIQDTPTSTDQAVTRIAYNSRGFVTQLTDPDDRRTVIDYSADGIDVTAVHVERADGTGRQTLVTAADYVNHRPRTVTTPGAAATPGAATIPPRASYFSYNRHGQLLSEIRPDGVQVSYTYDTPYTNPTTGQPESEGYLTLVETTGRSATFGYNTRKVLNHATDTTGVERHFTYDALDRVTAQTGGSVSHWNLDYRMRDPATGSFFADNRMGLEATTLTDQDGRTHRWSYDGRQRLVRYDDPGGNTTRHTWCCREAVASTTDARGHTTTWERTTYGSRTRKDGRPLAVSRADGTHVELDWDLLGRLKSLTDGRGSQQTVTYSPMGRVTALVATLGASTLRNWYEYDPVRGWLTRAGRGTSTTTPDYVFTPNPDESLRTVDGPWAGDTDLLSAGYDSMGRRTTLNVGNGSGTYADSRAYDIVDRLLNTAGTMGTTTVSYPTAGVIQTIPSSIRHANNVQTWIGVDGAANDRRLYGLYTYPNTGVEYSYVTYTDAGRLNQEYFNDRVTTYGYTPDARLHYADTSRYNYTTAQFVYSDLEYFGYDTNGNRSSSAAWWEQSGSFTFDQTTATHDNGDRLLTHGYLGGTSSPTHDNDGRLIQVANLAATRSYTWDAFGRLATITTTTGGTPFTTTFTYDALGRILESNTAGTITRNVWDDDTLLEERDATDAVVRRLFWNGFQEGGARYYYIRDTRGSVVGLTNESGDLIKRWTYSAYGRRTLRWEAPGTSAIDSPLGFAGYRILRGAAHQSWPLYLTPARAYDPQLGRWLSRDPLGYRNAIDGQNLYAYAANDPVNYVDPSGQATIHLLLGPEAAAFVFLSGAFLNTASTYLGSNGQASAGTLATAFVVGGLQSTAMFYIPGANRFTGAAVGALAGGFQGFVTGPLSCPNGSLGPAFQSAFLGAFAGALGGFVAGSFNMGGFSRYTPYGNLRQFRGDWMRANVRPTLGWGMGGAGVQAVNQDYFKGAVNTLFPGLLH